uniref:Ovule protein n=1 Tax=Mesocestoides corti TaxID=53468 RepID=A0A5K3F4D2_MESCO
MLGSGSCSRDTLIKSSQNEIIAEELVSYQKSFIEFFCSLGEIHSDKAPLLAGSKTFFFDWLPSLGSVICCKIGRSSTELFHPISAYSAL